MSAMTVRRLILLALAASAIAAATTLFVVRLTRPALPTGTYAYVTERQLIVMRGEHVVAQVDRLSDVADSADYTVVWSHSGNYVAMLADVRVRQLDGDEQQLIVVDTRSGAVRLSSCPGCSNLTPIGSDAVLADPRDGGQNPLALFTLADGYAHILLSTGAGQATHFLASGSRYVIAAQHDTAKQVEHLELLDPTGKDDANLGDFDSNDYMPAAVSQDIDGTLPTFAIAFRTNPGSCGDFPIMLFRPGAQRVVTDQSSLGPMPVKNQHGREVDDLWWGRDGHFYALMKTRTCGSTPSQQPDSLWRLDGNQWIRQPRGGFDMLRPIDKDNDVVLVMHACSEADSAVTCNTGTLYRESHGRRTQVADDVLAVSTPTPGARALPASAVPVLGPSAAAELVGDWSTCAGMADRLTISAGGDAAYSAKATGGGASATLHVTADGGELAAVVQASTVPFLTRGQRNVLRLVDDDKLVVTAIGERPWYLFRWNAELRNVPDSAGCGG